MGLKCLSGVFVLCLLASSTAAGEQQSAPAKPIEPKRLEFKISDYQAAKAQALKQRKMVIRRAPPGVPLVAEIQADGSILIGHRQLPASAENTEGKPQ